MEWAQRSWREENACYVWRAIVRVRLLVEPVPHIALRDEMSQGQLQAPHLERAHHKVCEHAPAVRPPEDGVEGKLEVEVEEITLVYRYR
jgi:hypothetical protein